MRLEKLDLEGDTFNTAGAIFSDILLPVMKVPNEQQQSFTSLCLRECKRTCIHTVHKGCIMGVHSQMGTFVPNMCSWIFNFYLSHFLAHVTQQRGPRAKKFPLILRPWKRAVSVCVRTNMWRVPPRNTRTCVHLLHLRASLCDFVTRSTPRCWKRSPRAS